MTPCPSQVIYRDLWLVDDEKVPQVLDQRLREKCFAFLYVVFFKDFIAREPYFLKIKFKFFTESFLVALLLCNRGKKHQHHHVEALEVHVTLR